MYIYIYINKNRYLRAHRPSAMAARASAARIAACCRCPCVSSSATSRPSTWYVCITYSHDSLSVT